MERATCGLAAAIVTMTAFQSLAQVPDTTSVGEESADSLVADRSRDKPFRPIKVDWYREGAARDTAPLVKAYVPDATELLEAVPGAFRYSMGNLGWPDQISLDALAPRDISITLDGIPMQDPLTGRPLFEFLPFDLLSSPAVYRGRHASGTGIEFRTRRFDVRQPGTELRYRNGGAGLQSISATHVQQRRTSVLGSPAILQVLFRYTAGEWSGDYPNSGSDISQIYGRVGFFAPNWAVRISNLMSRRHGGAHGGVVVVGNDFDTIYRTFNASVNHPNATFRMKRNDLRIAYDRRWLDDLHPLSMQFGWVTHVRRYRDGPPVEALVHEYALSAAQELRGFVPGQRLTARIFARFDDVRSATLFADTTDLGRTNVELLLATETPMGRSNVSGHLGLLGSAGKVIPELRLAVAAPLASYDLTGEISFSGRPPARVETGGVKLLAPVAPNDLDAESIRTLTVGAARSFGVSRIELKTYLTFVTNALDLWEAASDSFAVHQANSGLTWFGMTGVYGWRDGTDRGLYGRLTSSLQTAGRSADDPFLDAMGSSLPAFHSRIRFGTRYLLFQGDLDLDLYVVGRYWSSFKSRYYDPVSGLLALPGRDARTIGNSGTFDIRVEAGIRSATVYVGFENVLSGMSYPGTTLVPPYPLPSQAFRFGVFWPIDN